MLQSCNSWCGRLRSTMSQFKAKNAGNRRQAIAKFFNAEVTHCEFKIHNHELIEVPISNTENN